MSAPTSPPTGSPTARSLLDDLVVDHDHLDEILAGAGTSIPALATGELADLVDEKIDFTKLVKGPFGTLLEEYDRPIIAALLTLGISIGMKAATRGR